MWTVTCHSVTIIVRNISFYIHQAVPASIATINGAPTNVSNTFLKVHLKRFTMKKIQWFNWCFFIKDNA